MRRTLALGLFAAGALLSLGATGCSQNQMIDLAMKGSTRPPTRRLGKIGDRWLLAGDMHCHVMPPDAPHHVSRELPDTLSLAKEEGLDFVVLTPHVPARFFLDDDARAWVIATQSALRVRLERLRPDLVVVPGAEYTDRRWGHVGLSFADLAEVLGRVTSAEARAKPEAFFEAFAKSGGLAVLNHPANRPLVNPPFSQLRYDLSWRGFAAGKGAPPEIAWLDAHAAGVEIFNATATHLRDKFMVGDEERSIREATHLADRMIRLQRRRVASVGGSDSHGAWLRATTFVLARERTPAAIREGIAASRTCVRGPEACSLEVRSTGEDAWSGVGDEIPVDARPKMDAASNTIEARATGGDVTLLVNGEVAATGPGGTILRAAVPRGRCTVVRAVVGESWSSPVYVGCGVERGERASDIPGESTPTEDLLRLEEPTERAPLPPPRGGADPYDPDATPDPTIAAPPRDLPDELPRSREP